jgi:hypothetical protein
MKLNLLQAPKKMIFDDDDAKLAVEKFEIIVNNNKFKITAKDLIEFSKLDGYTIIGAAQWIAKSLDFKTSTFDGDIAYIGSKRGLMLYFVPVNLANEEQYIFIFSFGEFQPNRMNLIYEAVYQSIK